MGNNRDCVLGQLVQILGDQIFVRPTRSTMRTALPRASDRSDHSLQLWRAPWLRT